MRKRKKSNFAPAAADDRAQLPELHSAEDFAAKFSPHPPPILVDANEEADARVHVTDWTAIYSPSTRTYTRSPYTVTVSPRATSSFVVTTTFPPLDWSWGPVGIEIDPTYVDYDDDDVG